MKYKGKRLQSRTSGYVMLIPVIILFLSVNLLPFLYGVMLAFTNKKTLGKTFDFVGLKNFTDILLGPRAGEFYQKFSFTLIYSILSVGLSYIIGMCFALLLNREIKARSVFRALMLVPWLVSPVVLTVIWRYILNDKYGTINMFLQAIGIIDKPILFLANPTWAKISVVLISVWKEYPFMMAMLLSGMQGIDPSYYEPAEISGANGFQKFWYVTFPFLKPITVTCLSLQFIWTFNTFSFDNIYLLTEGGPMNATMSLSIDTMLTAFNRGKQGLAAAQALMMALFIIVCIILFNLVKFIIARVNRVSEEKVAVTEKEAAK